MIFETHNSNHYSMINDNGATARGCAEGSSDNGSRNGLNLENPRHPILL